MAALLFAIPAASDEVRLVIAGFVVTDQNLDCVAIRGRPQAQRSRKYPCLDRKALWRVSILPTLERISGLEIFPSRPKSPITPRLQVEMGCS